MRAKCYVSGQARRSGSGRGEEAEVACGGGFGARPKSASQPPSKPTEKATLSDAQLVAGRVRRESLGSRRLAAVCTLALALWIWIRHETESDGSACAPAIPSYVTPEQKLMRSDRYGGGEGLLTNTWDRSLSVDGDVLGAARDSQAN